MKDKYNLNKFYVKLGETAYTIAIVNHAERNIPSDPILWKLGSWGKNVSNFNDGAKCFDNIQINKIYEPPARTDIFFL